MAAQYGVKKPRDKHSATSTAIPLTTWLEPVGQDTAALTRTVTATTKRKTPKAIPALPVGNIENNLCTGTKYQLQFPPANPKEWLGDYTLGLLIGSPSVVY